MGPPSTAVVRLAIGLAVVGTAVALTASVSAAPVAQRGNPIDLVAPSTVRFDGAAFDDRAGVSVAGAGDVNGDGLPDVVVGADGADQNARPNSGSAYVVYGKAARTSIDLAALGDGFRIDGAVAGDRAASAVAGAGDLNGDGLADVLVGAELAAGAGRPGSGSAYVVFGRTTTATVDLAALGAGGFRIDGTAAGERAGGALAGAGDVNGDGLGDIVLGAARADSGGRGDSGSAYVVFGKRTSETVDLASPGAGGFRIDGAASGDRAGGAVTGAGDVNGDGLADVALGADGANNGGSGSGSAYVVFGKRDAATVELGTLGNGGFRIDGSASMLTGSSLAGAGDVNGDGRPDLLVGSPGFELFSGLAHVVFGSASVETVALASLDTRGFRIDGATAGDRLGGSVAAAGDVSGDRRADLLVGADGDDQNGRTDSGSAYLVLGKATMDTVDVTSLGAVGSRIDGAANNDRAAFSVAGIGDLDGDGRGELAVGAPRADHNARIDSGSVYVVAVDTKAPALTLRGPLRQRPLARRNVIVRATCDEPCRMSATGVVTIGRADAAIRLRPARASLAQAGSRTLELGLAPRAARRLGRLLGPGARARAAIPVRAVDSADNASTSRRTIELRR